MNHFIKFMVAGTIALSFLSCDNIYDDPVEEEEVVPKGNSFSNVDATDYAKWVYLKLSTGVQTTVAYNDNTAVPADWDLALHRYDTKTNGGAALETAYSSLDDLRSAVATGTFERPATSAFKPDEADSIIVDMSTMMQGYVGYAKTSKNLELGKWMNLNMSTMPPIYTTSDKVYLLLLKDLTVAAIRFTGYANPNKYNTKGYISFDYIYPLEFKK